MARVVAVAMAAALPALLQVRARSGSFRRGGEAFGPDPRILNTDELDEAQVRAIVNESELEVTGSDDGETFVPVAPIDPEPASERLEDLVPGDVRSGDAAAGGTAELERLQRELDAAHGDVGALTERVEEIEKALGERDATILELRAQLAAQPSPADQAQAPGTPDKAEAEAASQPADKPKKRGAAS